MGAAISTLTRSGTQVVLAESKTKKTGTTFAFLDLPPELRNRIYEFALVAEKFDYQSGPLQYSGQPLRVKGLSPQILATCHFIHDEASPILYGSNHFILYAGVGHREKCEKMLDFLAKHQDYIRNVVVIEFGTKEFLGRLFSRVEHMPNIERLQLSSLCDTRFRTPVTFSQGLKSLIRELHRTRKDQNEKKQAMEVVQFTYSGKLGIETSADPIEADETVITDAEKEWNLLVHGTQQRLRAFLT